MFFITPDYSVAINPKVASSTLARAIIREFCPDEEQAILSASYPEGKGPDNSQWQGLCPKEKQPSKPVVLVVRNPADRFCSAMAQCGLDDVDATIAGLASDVPVLNAAGRPIFVSKNPHFRPQVEKLNGGTAFRMEDLDQAAEYIGLTLPLPVVNEASVPKPVLTEDQAAAVRQHYASDQALYDSL